MSLISLLFALAAERYLSSASWQFNTFYKYYIKLIKRINIVSPWASTSINIAFIFIPVFACYLLLSVANNSLLYLILSTVILIVCLGCVKTRASYKQYLMSAFRGEKTSCELHHAQLIQDKNLPDMSFGNLLIWLNYRYYIAIMLFFIVFGAPGALFYRLLTRVTEQQENIELEASQSVEKNNDNDEDFVTVNMEAEVKNNIKTLLFWLDWLPVRIVAFGYMLVGHFSKALPTWLENIFDIKQTPHQLLSAVAEKSEDVMIEVNDCTAEPCLLVRLAKRTLLLCLAVISVLTLTGVIS